ncbi:hypothetical protein U1Q18_049421 [Sarracenia purpurea var. burkii]
MLLNEVKEKNSSKRAIEDDEIHLMNRGKKSMLATLNLSLVLPDVSLSLAASNLATNSDPPTRPCWSL